MLVPALNTGNFQLQEVGEFTAAGGKSFLYLTYRQ
jgi:hypothetical protein